MSDQGAVEACDWRTGTLENLKVGESISCHRKIQTQIPKFIAVATHSEVIILSEKELKCLITGGLYGIS